jgi:hypothetical protein
MARAPPPMKMLTREAYYVYYMMFELYSEEIGRTDTMSKDHLAHNGVSHRVNEMTRWRHSRPIRRYNEGQCFFVISSESRRTS